MKSSKTQRLKEYKVAGFGFKMMRGRGSSRHLLRVSFLHGPIWEGEKRLKLQKDNSKDVTWRDTGNGGSDREKWEMGFPEKENAGGFVPAST